MLTIPRATRPPSWPATSKGGRGSSGSSTPFPGDDPSVFAVHFEPGGRTKPHMHGRGQLLHIAAGEGIIGTVDGRRHVTAGDVVSVMPNEWHWHGATPTTPMTHVTVQPSGPGSVDWNVDERDWAEEYS